MSLTRIILFCLVLVACSPQRKLNRKINRAEKYALKHGLTITDSITITDIDTFITETVKVDTVTQLVNHDTTIVITNNRSELKYVYVPETKEIWHEVTCFGDTIVQTEIHTVETRKIIHKETLTRGQKRWLWVLIVFGVVYVSSKGFAWLKSKLPP